MRHLIKTSVAAALHRSGANALIGGLTAGRQPLVLGYHSVVEDVRAHEGRAIPPNLISVGMLERQLDWIGRRYRFLTLDEVAAALESGRPFSQPSALVTFDDGYAGVYHHAWPLLRRKGIPAAAFVVTDMIGRTQLQIYDKLYLALMKVLPALRHSLPQFTTLFRTHRIHLRQAPTPDLLRDSFATMRHLYTTCDQPTLWRVIEALETIERVDDSRYPELHAMDWDMVLKLDRGGVAIGSHTHTHALLTLEEPSAVAEQLKASSRTLQQRLGRPVAHLAYPDGRFDSDVVSAVAQAGYRFAYTTCRHRDKRHPRLTIARTLLWERSCLDGRGAFSEDVMSCHVAGVFDGLARCRHARRAAGQMTGESERARHESPAEPGSVTDTHSPVLHV